MTIGVFAMAMMAVLILLSSCSVRKAFHSFLDIPVTQSLNVNKATVTSNSICYAEVNEDQAGSNFASASTLSVDAGILILGLLLSQLLPFSSNYTVPVLPGYCTTQQLPYYILYKQIKVLS